MKDKEAGVTIRGSLGAACCVHTVRSVGCGWLAGHCRDLYRGKST